MKTSSYFSNIPFSEIERVGARRCLYNGFFNVTWVLGAFCNYKCSYCWPYAHSSIRDHFPLEVLIKTIDEIKKQARERGYNSFNFTFHGGEPTIYKGYVDLIRYYADDSPNCNCQTVHMTTNLSPGLKWLEKWVEAVSPLNYATVIASFHKEFAKREPFADKVKFLQEQEKIKIVARIVMVPECFEDLWEDALYFRSRGINVSLMPQKDNDQEVVSGYTDSMLKKMQDGLPMKSTPNDQNDQNTKKPYYTMESTDSKLKKIQNALSLVKSNPNNQNNQNTEKPYYTMELMDAKGKVYFIDEHERMNSLNFNKFKGWECSAGYGAVVIERNGDVRRGHMCWDQILGNMKTGFKLFSKPEPCITESSCSTGADMEIPKRKKAVLYLSGNLRIKKVLKSLSIVRLHLKEHLAQGVFL